MPDRLQKITQRFDQLLRSALSVLDEVVNEDYHPGEDDLEGLCNAARKLRREWRSIEEAQPHHQPRPARRSKTRSRSKRSTVAGKKVQR
ncbi:MAG: hypothetical protein RBU21_09295 [FCB group bacterium]|jgi:hypothetical protein|nr:hypothetical protein [FCB group bacterium]